MAELIFYSFAVLLIIGAICVVFANNPVKSVLFLVFCFLNAAALLIMIGAEFVPAIMIIVYVGAVVVLFLFIVMTLNTENFEYKKSFSLKLIPFLISIILAITLSINFFDIETFTKGINTSEAPNTTAIGMILYTNYFLQFQLCGIILLVALIGAIVLTDRTRTTDVKKQDVWKQMMVSPKERIEIVNKMSGDGI